MLFVCLFALIFTELCYGFGRIIFISTLKIKLKKKKKNSLLLAGYGAFLNISVITTFRRLIFLQDSQLTLIFTNISYEPGRVTGALKMLAE